MQQDSIGEKSLVFFLSKNVATKLLTFVATQHIIKTVKGIRKRKGGNQNEKI